MKRIRWPFDALSTGKLGHDVAALCDVSSTGRLPRVSQRGDRPLPSPDGLPVRHFRSRPHALASPHRLHLLSQNAYLSTIKELLVQAALFMAPCDALDGAMRFIVDRYARACAATGQEPPQPLAVPAEVGSASWQSRKGGRILTAERGVGRGRLAN